MNSDNFPLLYQRPLKAAAAARNFHARLLSDPMGRVVIAAVAIIIGLFFVDFEQHELLHWSELVPLKEWLLHFNYVSIDSWNPMREALEHARAGHADSLYQDLFFGEHVKFQYPPTALLPLLGMQSLGFDTTNIFLNNINRILIALDVLGIAWLFRLVLIRTRGRDAADAPAGMAGTVLAGATTLMFYPLMMGFWVGQIQIWIDTGFTFACIAILSNRRLTAGALVGLLCLIKPQMSIFALWALVRKEWRFLIGAAIATIPCVLISLAVFGLESHLQYLRVLSFLSQRGEATITNNSVNGILNEMLGTADWRGFSEHGFPDYNPIVHIASMATAALMIGISLWPRPRRGFLNGLIDFQIAGLAYTMAAPIAWEHHYGIMAPILATLFCLLATAPEDAAKARRLVIFAVLFFFSAICVTSIKYNVDTLLNRAHGYLFFIGLGVIAMLWRVPQSSNEAIALPAAGTSRQHRNCSAPQAMGVVS